MSFLPSNAANALRGTSAAISGARRSLDAKVNNLLARPVSRGIGSLGFLFDYEGETSVTADSDVTSHYTERNQFFQDHVALKPLEITMRGFVGEVVFDRRDGVVGALNALQNKLTVLPAYLGKYTPSAVQKIQRLTTQATETVNRIDHAIARTQGVIGLIAGNEAPTRIREAFSKLMAMREAAEVFTLESPFGALSRRNPTTGENEPLQFVIRRLMVVAPEESKAWADIAVTMTEIRFAEAFGSEDGVSPSAASARFGGRAGIQRQGTTKKGLTAGVDTPFRTLSESFGGA